MSQHITADRGKAFVQVLSCVLSRLVAANDAVRNRPWTRHIEGTAVAVIIRSSEEVGILGVLRNLGRVRELLPNG